MKSSTAIIIFIVVVIAAACLFFYTHSSMVYAELNSLDLIPQPERFTELYFDNASNLPRATVKDQPISFAFTIHNVEATTTVYPYEIYFANPDGSQVSMADGIVTLASNDSTTIPVSYTFSASNLTGKVVVNLPSLNNQSIDFLVPDNN